MKKALVACLAVAALFAIAGSAAAITCTVDTRPAATLLVPYFEATFNADGTIEGTDANALDTIVTMGNASDAPMLAHVCVWSQRSELVLDFNIALTGFDIQSFSVASVLRGFLPQTGFGSPLEDGCQRNPNATVFPDTSGGGFLRTKAESPTGPSDNKFATTLYANGPFSTAFLFEVIDSLDQTADSNTCGGAGVDQVIKNPIQGYITIDHANYCSLSNPSDANYWTHTAAGMENNLWGDYIYTEGSGFGTGGYSMVSIEADPSLDDETGAPTDSSWGINCANGSLDCQGKRTFYRRYAIALPVGLDPCGGNIMTDGGGDNDFDCHFGDSREPLGLRYAARWFDFAPNVTSFFDVWRASAVPSSNGGLADLLDGGKCDTSEPIESLSFYDEDENTAQGSICPSPCTQPQFNIPLETQRVSIAGFPHPSASAGWVEMSFYNNAVGKSDVNGNLDQAWVTYDFEGASAFLSAGAPAAQLDPSNCQPLLVVPDDFTNEVIPVLFGSGPVPGS